MNLPKILVYICSAPFFILIAYYFAPVTTKIALAVILLTAVISITCREFEKNERLTERLESARREKQIAQEREEREERLRKEQACVEEAARILARQAPMEWFLKALQAAAGHSGNATPSSSSVSDDGIFTPTSETSYRTSFTSVQPGYCMMECFEVADTLLVPCNHLAICQVCWDRMCLIDYSTVNPRCPSCNAPVEDQIKVFR